MGEDDDGGGAGGSAGIGIGEACTRPDDCDQGSCIDGFCCAASTCDGICLSCGVPGSEGNCVAVEAGEADDTCGEGVCDGSAGCARGTLLASQVIGSAGDQLGIGVAALSDGRVAVGGAFNGSFTWGSQHPAPMTGFNSVVTVLDSELDPTWARNISDPNVGAAMSAFDANGDGAIRTTGPYTGTISLLGQMVTAPSGGASFLAAFDAGGGISWLRNMTTSGVAFPYGLTVADDGSTYVVGGQLTDVDFGDGLTQVVGANDGFLIKYDPSGNVAWRKMAVGSGSEAVFSAAVSSQNEVVIVGTFNSSDLDFGGGPLAAQADNDVFLVKYDADGNHLWSRAVGETAFVRLNDLTTDGDGNIVAVGYFDGTIALDGVTLESAGGNDILVMSFDPLGNLRWASNFGNFNDQVARRVANDARGNVYVTGFFTGSIDFGRGALQTEGAEDGFIAKLASDGSALWSRALAGPADEHRVEDVSIAPDGSVVVTGWTVGQATFGGMDLPPADGLDIFMARLAP